MGITYRRDGSELTFNSTKNNLIIAKDENNQVSRYLYPIGLNAKVYDKLEKNDSGIFLINSDNPKSYLSKFKLDSYQVNKTTNNKFEISVVYDNSMFKKCADKVYKRHYIKSTPNGIIVYAHKRGELAGFVTVHKLTYSNPKARQQYLKIKHNINEEDEQRKYAANHIAWINRVVTLEKFEDKHVATELCQNLPAVLQTLFPNKQLNQIEVISSINLEKFQQLGYESESLEEVNYGEEKDLFVNAGYKRINLEIKTESGNISNKNREDGGWYDTQVRRKLKNNNLIEDSIKVVRYYYVYEI